MSSQLAKSTESRTDAFTRTGLAVCSVAFGVVLVLALLLAPKFDYTLEGVAYVEEFAAHVDDAAPSLLFWALSVLLGVPALLAVSRVARSNAPALGLTGLILGYFFVIPAGLDMDEVIYASLKAGLDTESTNAVLESVEDNLPSSYFGLLWFVGLLGLILLGVAMLRGKSAPTWVGLAFVVAPVAIPLTWFSGVEVALIAAWVLLAIGFAGCAYVLATTHVAPRNS
jgi:hypothetical protein